MIITPRTRYWGLMMLRLKANMGGLDRLIRTAVGITLLSLGPFSEIIKVSMIAEIAMALVGVFALLSAASAYCVIYHIAGTNTLGKEDDTKK